MKDFSGLLFGFPRIWCASDFMRGTNLRGENERA